MDVEKFYCNPVPFSDGKRHTNPDPFVMRWCGTYYCYAPDSDGVKVSISEDLVHWEYKGYAIKEPDKRDYWAPSVFYWNGVFYMFFFRDGCYNASCNKKLPNTLREVFLYEKESS